MDTFHDHQRHRKFIYPFLLIVAILSVVAIFKNINQPKIQIQDILPKVDIVLVGTNDIHGAAYPTILSRKDTGEKYNYGGLVYMARMIQIIKEQNKGNLLYLDAGDQFQGGIQASKIISSGEIMSDYFNHLKTKASAVGNHEFDFGLEFLHSYLSKVNHDILSANFIDKAKDEFPLKNQQKSQIYSFPIKTRNLFVQKSLSEIKIGVIGLSTIQTAVRPQFLDGTYPESYKFQAYKEHVLNEVKNLKLKGAHAIVILSHEGNECNRNSDYGIWTIENQPTNIPCQLHGSIFKLIDDLPQGSINAVIQGHHHTQSHYFYKGIPIIGTVNGGFYFNTIRFRFTLDGDKAYIIDKDLMIQGPIPVCQKVFQKTRKCEYIHSQSLEKAGELVQWTFHGEKVYADSQLSDIFKSKYAQKMKPYEYEIVKNYIETPLYRDYKPSSGIGNLLTNIMAESIISREDLKFDFLILNSGGFRTTWYPGVIRYAELHSMLPFDNEVYSFKISGKDLKKMIQILQNGEKRYYPTWGLQQMFEQTIQSGQIEDNRPKLKLKSLVSTLNKQPISESQIYTGVTIGFLIKGGDDFSSLFKQQGQINIIDKTKYSMKMRDLVKLGLQMKKSLTDDDLKGPNKMERLIIEKNQCIQTEMITLIFCIFVRFEEFVRLN